MTRRRSKARSRKPKPRAPKTKLTMQQMLDRVPDTAWLNTKQVRHVFNDCTKVTVYRYVNQGKLERHRRYGSAANYYKKEEVVALARAMFTPRPSSGSEIRKGAVDEDERPSKKTTQKGPASPVPKKPKRKPRGGVRGKTKGRKK